ncbi:MAG: hypothetical protein ACI89X_001192 [Planctomycetota bacterium]|jgi:hypothetical protein
MRISISALLLTAALPCQGNFTPFGSGCSLQGQTPAIGYSGSPAIGQTFSITYSGPNYTFNSAQQMAQPFLALGTQGANFTLPTTGLIYQPIDCVAYMLPISLLPMAQHPNLPEYESGFAITIPNNSALVGYQFFAQWLMVHSQCGFVGCSLSGLITSDAAVVTIGP